MSIQEWQNKYDKTITKMSDDTKEINEKLNQLESEKQSLQDVVLLSIFGVTTLVNNFL